MVTAAPLDSSEPGQRHERGLRALQGVAFWASLRAAAPPVIAERRSVRPQPGAGDTADPGSTSGGTAVRGADRVAGGAADSLARRSLAGDSGRLAAATAITDTLPTTAPPAAPTLPRQVSRVSSIPQQVRPVGGPAAVPVQRQVDAPAEARGPIRVGTPSQRGVGGAAVKARRLVLLGDGTVLAGAIVASYVLEAWAVCALALVILLLLAVRAATARGVAAVLAIRPVLRAGGLVLGVGSTLALLSGSVSTGPQLVIGGVAVVSTLVAERLLLLSAKVRRGLGFPATQRCLVVSESGVSLRFAPHGRAAAGPSDTAVMSRTRSRFSADDVVEKALSSQVDQVTVVPGKGLGAEEIRELSWALETTGIELYVHTPLAHVAPHRISLTRGEEHLVMRVGSTTPRGLTAAAKGAFDRVTAVVLLALISPLLLVLAAAIRLDSPGPAVFRQRRVREHGAEFTIFKFRTMRQDAEQLLAALMARNEHGPDGVLFKMKNDPRITRVGRLLRATSLDELPQLVNVVRGEMSLIGPRPALPSEVAKYDSRARRRLAVKPGMTGLWQVSGRSNLSWEESLEHDLDYVDNWSATRDAEIALRTVKAVIANDGAY